MGAPRHVNTPAKNKTRPVCSNTLQNRPGLSFFARVVLTPLEGGDHTRVVCFNSTLLLKVMVLVGSMKRFALTRYST